MFTSIVGGIIGAIIVEAILHSPKAMAWLRAKRDAAKAKLDELDD